MGGNAFKDADGNILTTGVKQQNVDATIDHFVKNHLAQLGINSYEKLGSTGKKSLSGDIDIVIDSQDSDIKTFKKDIVSNVKTSLSDGDAKLLGGNIAVMYPIQGDQMGEYAQIDVMLSPDTQSTAWLMSGVGNEGVKGVYRNLLLAHIASQKSKSGNPREKFTISFPGGLQVKTLPDEFDPDNPKSKRKWVNTGDRESNPAKILKTLGINANPNDIDTFEKLVDVIQSDSNLNHALTNFEDYIARYLQIDPIEANKAMDYIKKKIVAETILRRYVKASIGSLR